MGRPSTDSSTSVRFCTGLYKLGGGTSPSTLATLDPTTGAVATPIGPTGVAGGLVGLAWDAATATMYAVDGVNGLPSSLYTVSLVTGLATPIGSTGVQLGSLQFGPDGLLYAGGTGVNAGDIYRIAIPSGTPTLVGNYGLGGGVTGLTLRGTAGTSTGPFPAIPTIVPDGADPGDGFFPNAKTQPLTTSETILVPWALHVEEPVTNVAGILFRVHYDSNELDLLHTWGGTLNFFNST